MFCKSDMNYSIALIVLFATITLAIAVCSNNVQAQYVGSVFIHNTLSTQVNVPVCSAANDERRRPAVINPYGSESWVFSLAPSTGSLGWWCYFYMVIGGRTVSAHSVPVWPTTRDCINCLWQIRPKGFYRKVPTGSWVLVTRWQYWQ